MRYKPFVTVETFNEFKKIKLSSDSSNITYITYDDPVQTFGTPDILWKQIVFVLDKGIIYSKGQIFTNIEDTLTSQDIKTINSYNIVGSGNVEIIPSNLIISSYYQTSYLSNSYLLIQSGDTVENAISKLEKAIIDNESVISSALNNLNNDISYITDNVSYTINETQNDVAVSLIDLYDRMGILESTTASYINNYINNVQNYEGGSKIELVRSDWNESNPLSYAYILNKPTIPTIPTETKLSYELKGSGNAVTNISVNNHKITLNKESYFLTENNLNSYLKTINNQSIVGTGNVTLSGLPTVNSSYNGKILMVVNGQWAMISPSTFYSGSGVPNDINGNDGDIYIQTN